MIKFILLALLCLSLSEEIFAKVREDRIGNDGYRLELDFDDARCCKDKKKKNESPEKEVICLDAQNSKIIADAVLEVLEKAHHSYESIKALRIPEFMVGRITYQEWAENIELGLGNFEGFSNLQRLVKKFVLCKKVCKVFFFLRQALREKAANAQVFEELINEEYFLKVVGDLIIVGDVRKEIEANFAASDVPIRGVIFESQVMIIDSSLLDTKGWAGMDITIDVDSVIVPRTFSWMVDGDPG
jgi:hypothetical protein